MNRLATSAPPHHLNGFSWSTARAQPARFPPGRPDVPDAYRQVCQPVFVPGSMGTSSFRARRPGGRDGALVRHGLPRRGPRAQPHPRTQAGRQRRAAPELEQAGITVRCPQTRAWPRRRRLPIGRREGRSGRRARRSGCPCRSAAAARGHQGLRVSPPGATEANERSSTGLGELHAFGDRRALHAASGWASDAKGLTS